MRNPSDILLVALTLRSPMVNWKNPLSQNTGWDRLISNRVAKEKVAKKLALRLRNGDVVGVGSGSTSYLTLLELAKRRDKEGLSFKAITTSIEMEITCTALHIPVTMLGVERPDWSFDGADEVDSNNNLIKGRGGALLREKLLIKASPEVYIVTDSSKLVKRLGQNFAVPVEVHPEALQLVDSSLRLIKSVTSITLRQGDGKDGPVITEGGNLLLDVKFSNIPDGMEQKLKSIVGVVETGLFMNYPIILV